ncbi:MAG: hypothetical protein LIO55_06335 [Oscillospiraceae bacterium]|nr:hypothetical protein [Oscillospiraceae bacterium]
MKRLGTYWRCLLALALLAAAVLTLLLCYIPEQRAFRAERERLNTEISGMQETLAQYARYADTDAAASGAARAELDASRAALYSRFPTAWPEEAQILYVRALEQHLDTELAFRFGSVSPLATLSDGAELGALTLTVQYETDYRGFREMLEHISNGKNVISVAAATLHYDRAQEHASGSLTLRCYYLDSPRNAYAGAETPPVPEVGKENPFV